MKVIDLIFAILLANRVNLTQTSVIELYPPSEVNVLPEDSTEAVFALQIQQIRTSETTPAASAGNNLNVIGASVPSNSLLQTEHFQAISTIYSFENKKATDKKYDDVHEGNDEVPFLPFDENVSEDKKIRPLKESEKEKEETLKTAALVWDNCWETMYRENQNKLVKVENDMVNAKQILSPQYRSNIYSILSENLRKRDTIGKNSTTAMKAWLETYNNLKNAKTEGRRQPKQDSNLFSKIIKPTTTTENPTTSSTVQIVPITKEIFNEPAESFNITLELVVTENNIKASYTEDWFETKERSKIRFGGLPQTETYLIPTLKLEEGFYPFSFISDFFSMIYPFEFPIGLIKDIVWGKFTFPYSFLQSIKVESTFLAFIILFACIALIIPSYLFILSILSLFSTSRRDDELETGALFPEAEETKCNDRVLAIVTLLVVVICGILISGMAVSNEQAHAAAIDSKNVVSCACADLAAWLATAARELHHSIVPPVDLVMHAYREDLKNVEALLGEPIQQAIASESGIDLVLDSLADIISESEDLSTKISSLRDVSVRAGGLASAASDRIKDLARQLDNMKKFCSTKDAPLCDTINTNFLQLQMKFDMILHEQQLLELRSLGVENLTRAITTARQEFRSLPHAISTQTTQTRTDILRDIEYRRQAIHSSVKILRDIVRHLTAGLHTAARQLDAALIRVQRYEFWRWTLILACMVSFSFVMILIISALLCGCGRAKNHAKRSLQVFSVWLCLVSLILWSVISAIFLITGHAEVYICHALWDVPQYEVLTALLDRPSPLLHNGEGIFDALFKDLENITIDVSIKDVLRECEKDRPAYIVFQLDKILDVNKETSYFEWAELQADLGRLASSIDVGFLKTMSINFNKLLNAMLRVSDVNLAKYRMDYNNPVVGKDLPALVDQLENIAAQVTDLSTAGRLETLATRTQRLYIGSIKPLEQLRADIVFKLTELELQLMPFRRKLNISLSHIHTAQYYIDNQGDVIAQKKVSMYASRLTSHVAGWRTHVLMTVGKQAARCKPLFTVFSAVRTLICTKYIAPLHGWWVCGFLLGLLWSTILMPLCVKLWRAYGRKIRDQETMTLANLNSGQQGTPTTALCDGSSNWNTPGPPPAPRSDSW